MAGHLVADVALHQFDRRAAKKGAQDSLDERAPRCGEIHRQSPSAYNLIDHPSGDHEENRQRDTDPDRNAEAAVVVTTVAHQPEAITDFRSAPLLAEDIRRPSVMMGLLPIGQTGGAGLVATVTVILKPVSWSTPNLPRPETAQPKAAEKRGAND